MYFRAHSRSASNEKSSDFTVALKFLRQLYYFLIAGNGSYCKYKLFIYLFIHLFISTIGNWHKI